MLKRKNINKQITIRINEQLYNLLKHRAEESNRTFSNLVETLLIESTGFKNPNEVTLQAMEQACNNKNLETIKKGEFKDFVNNL